MNYGFVRNFFVFQVLSFFSPISVVVNGIWSTSFICVANDDMAGIVGSVVSVIVRIFSSNLDFWDVNILLNFFINMKEKDFDEDYFIYLINTINSNFHYYNTDITF